MGVRMSGAPSCASTEPSTYSFADLVRDKTTVWDGITNPAALKHLKTIQKGDAIAIYHTGDEKQAVGLATAESEPFPDPKRPNLTVVRIKAGKALASPVPLADIRVIAVEQAVAGPLCTRHLADLGADVIKIERPDGGDFARDYDSAVRGQSAYFVWLNHGKRSVTLDLAGADGREDSRFEQALFVMTTVMHRRGATHAVVDGGTKTFNFDSGPPLCSDPSVSYVRKSDEHGVLQVPEGRIAPGDRLLFVPSHCDPTVALHDYYVCVRGLSGPGSNGAPRVEAVWPVAARGALS